MLCFQAIFVQALGMLAFIPLIETKCGPPLKMMIFSQVIK